MSGLVTEQAIDDLVRTWHVPLWAANAAVELLPEELQQPVVDYVTQGVAVEWLSGQPLSHEPADLIERAGRSTDPAIVRSVLRIVMQAVDDMAWELLSDVEDQAWLAAEMDRHEATGQASKRYMARRRLCCDVATAAMRRLRKGTKVKGDRLMPYAEQRSDAPEWSPVFDLVPARAAMPVDRAAGAAAGGTWDVRRLLAADRRLPVPPSLWALACAPLPDDLDGLMLVVAARAAMESDRQVGGRFVLPVPLSAQTRLAQRTSDPATALVLIGLGAAGIWSLAGCGADSSQGEDDDLSWPALVYGALQVAYVTVRRVRTFGLIGSPGPPGHPVRVALADGQVVSAALDAALRAGGARWVDGQQKGDGHV